MPNRRQCESALATELSQAQRFGSRLAFVLADLDEFKVVNDRHGHPAGDQVLREFSDILRELVRDADVAARWGGDEFALILPGTDLEGAAVLVERIRSTLEHRSITVDDHALSITASFGVAIFPDQTSSAQLIASADTALYAAKRGGKNRVEAAQGTLRLSA
jgi:diguanylate cyclase (GGDEF)-like protein